MSPITQRTIRDAEDYSRIFVAHEPCNYKECGFWRYYCQFGVFVPRAKPAEKIKAPTFEWAWNAVVVVVF